MYIKTLRVFGLIAHYLLLRVGTMKKLIPKSTYIILETPHQFGGDLSHLKEGGSTLEEARSKLGFSKLYGREGFNPSPQNRAYQAIIFLYDVDYVEAYEVRVGEGLFTNPLLTLTIYKITPKYI